MKYFFIIVAVVLALITGNGIFAKSTSKSGGKSTSKSPSKSESISSSKTTQCVNADCKTVCTKNGKEVPCEGPEFDKILEVKLCNEKDCQKVCAKKSKKGSCKKTAKVLHNQILNECLCQ